MSEDLIDNDLEDLQQFRDLNALSGGLSGLKLFFCFASYWLVDKKIVDVIFKPEL